MFGKKEYVNPVLHTKFQDGHIAMLAGIPVMTYEKKYITPLGVTSTVTIARFNAAKAEQNPEIAEWYAKFKKEYPTESGVTVAIVPDWMYKKFVLFKPCSKKDAEMTLAYELAKSKLHLSMSREELAEVINDFAESVDSDQTRKYSAQITRIMRMFDIIVDYSAPSEINSVDLELCSQFMAAIAIGTSPEHIRYAIRKAARPSNSAIDKEWKRCKKESKKTEKLARKAAKKADKEHAEEESAPTESDVEVQPSIVKDSEDESTTTAELENANNASEEKTDGEAVEVDTIW